MTAGVAVQAAVYAIDTIYSYLVPPDLEDAAAPGVRVSVPFGRGNRPTEGFVLTVDPSGDTDGLKALSAVLDRESVLDPDQLRLAAFLRERYFCTMYDACRVLLPAGLWYKKKQSWCLTDAGSFAAQTAEELGPENGILRRLYSAGGTLDSRALEGSLGTEGRAALGRLISGGLVASMTEVESVPEKTQEIVSLEVSAEEARAAAQKKSRSAPNQAAVLSFLADQGTASLKEIRYYTEVPPEAVRRMAKSGWVSLQKKETFRELPDPAPEQEPPMTLSPQQQEVFNGLERQRKEPKPGVSLLYGVTGSGKTAVYLQLICQVLEEGRSAVLLVPEIALTPQLTRLFRAQLGETVAVLHSALGIGDRYDQWRRIREGKARVVVGARSAVFAPVRDPGLFIVDEEHEHSYKSQSGVRYHARETAIYRAAVSGALCVLGSATPSLESMTLAKNGVYRLFRLDGRYNRIPLPAVTIADTKKDLLSGNSFAVGDVLRQELADNIRDGYQSILFLNRRGSRRLMICTSCGYVPKCDRCTVSLTWHTANNRLMCHYCGRSVPVPNRCPECGGVFRAVGAGTQRVQEELSILFPDTQVLRMDADTVSASNTHDKILRKFEKEKIPILVGTQMVAKGLNLMNVTLVGVLDADMALYVDDYRAAENTFDLITQVIGRAGRGNAPGRAVIQTMTPENRVIRLAAHQDYDSFFESESALRENRLCPPNCDLFTITFTSLDENLCLQASLRFRELLEAALREWTEQEDPPAWSLMGPAPAPVARVNLYYRFRLTLATKNSRPLRRILERCLRSAAEAKENKGVSVFADINASE